MKYSKSKELLKERKNLLLIGNGFDLDLGLQTKYIDFLNSTYFETTISGLKPQGLLEYIKNIRDSNLDWFDLEQTIKHYAIIQSSTGVRIVNYLEDTPENDRIFFERLREGLMAYLENEMNKRVPNTNSAAFKMFEAILANGYYSIYNFNYTDLGKLAEKTKLKLESCPIQYIHGNCKDKSIIIGIDEKAEIEDGFNFLFKSFSPYFRSVNIINEMKSANDIVFFGLSFGNIDYIYFEDFFQSIMESAPDEKDKKTITILTRSEKSRMSILGQLKKMKINIMNLYNKCHLNFIRTDFKEYPEDEALFLRFLEWQKVTCHSQYVRVKNARMRELASMV